MAQQVVNQSHIQKSKISHIEWSRLLNQINECQVSSKPLQMCHKINIFQWSIVAPKTLAYDIAHIPAILRLFQNGGNCCFFIKKTYIEFLKESKFDKNIPKGSVPNCQ